MALTPPNSTLVCPHCFGKIELTAATTYKFPCNLSIICMTKGDDSRAGLLLWMAETAEGLGAEMVLGVEGEGKAPDFFGLPVKVFPIQTKGYVEGALNQLASHAHGKWVLRLDDDESISPAMFDWLQKRKYLDCPAWAFPTAALWGDEEHFITTPPLWPDTHVRLTSWHMSMDWPDEPHGKPKWVSQAKVAPVAIRHHKYLVKSRDERLEIAKGYETKLRGGGLGRRLAFNLPEEALGELRVSSVGDGPLSNVQPNSGEVIKTK